MRIPLALLALLWAACAVELEPEPSAAVSGKALSARSLALTVEPADDFVYITVNGVRRRVVARDRIDELDVTHWFVAGRNTLRIQAINSTGPATYALALTLAGEILIEERCANAPCDGTAQRAGVVFDRSYDLSLPDLPAAASLTVSGPAGEHIYLNDAYTGLTVPSTLSLAQGEYRVGVGVGEASQGSYHEQTITLAAGERRDLTPTAAAPSVPTNVTRVTILPVRNTHHGGTSAADTGVLTQADIDTLRGQAEATSRAWVTPFSYGLTRWEISVQPVVEGIALQRAAAADSAPDTARLLREAGLSELEQRFDSVIYLYSELTAEGNPVAHAPCCFWGWGQMVTFQNGLLRAGDASQPNVYLLHEMLHDYEAFHSTRRGLYHGLSGVHGAELHGYARDGDDENDFVKFYRTFMRGQVAEVAAMREGIAWTAARPNHADVWIGVFETMRFGVDW